MRRSSRGVMRCSWKLQGVGWLMGFEPTTTGITIRDSTAELQPPFWIQGPGAPDRIRTCYPRLRRPVLYPDELRAPWLRSTVPDMKDVGVGVEGFEPPTSCSQSKCATRLRYTPTGCVEIIPAGVPRPGFPRPEAEAAQRLPPSSPADRAALFSTGARGPCRRPRAPSPLRS